MLPTSTNHHFIPALFLTPVMAVVADDAHYKRAEKGEAVPRTSFDLRPLVRVPIKVLHKSHHVQRQQQGAATSQGEQALHVSGLAAAMYASLQVGGSLSARHSYLATPFGAPPHRTMMRGREAIALHCRSTSAARALARTHPSGEMALHARPQVAEGPPIPSPLELRAV
mmetsp:Transcript_64703/g.124806  ORF Transcript_64703/g.124806 Transcript_64703/m.124806 type:complete len:169 (-) Transcript_64703:1485-1991(-)